MICSDWVTGVVGCATDYYGYTSPGLPVSLLPSGPLPPGLVQPILKKTSAVRHNWLSSVSMPAGDSPVESDLLGGSSLLAAIVPDVGSSPLESMSRRSLSLDSVQSDGSFHSATDSSTGQAPTMHPEPTFDPHLCREGPFKAANPHPRIGEDNGGCACRFTTYQDSDFAVQDRHFGLQLHTHVSWCGWGHRNLPAYWAINS